jgi:hypothetical protein
MKLTQVDAMYNHRSALRTLFGLVAAPLALAACNGIVGLRDIDVVDGSGDAAADVRVDAAPDGGGALEGGVAHFLQSGASVPVNLKVDGDADDTVTLTKNGPFSFARSHAAGKAYTVVVGDSNCWANQSAGTLPLTGLEVRCRVIGQSASTTDATTTSSSYGDIPGLPPLKFATDVAATVLVVFTAPLTRFEANTASMGHIAINVDGVVTDEAIHQPTAEGFNFSVSIVALRSVGAGDHVIKAQFRSDTPNPPYVVGDKWGTQITHKNLDAVVLDSLQTFRSVGTADVATPFTANVSTHALQPWGTASVTTVPNSVVLAGLNVPDVIVGVPTGNPPHSSGVMHLLVDGQTKTENIQHFIPGRRRNTAMLWADRTNAAVAVTAGWRWFSKGSIDGTSATLTNATGAPRLFAVSFDPSLEVPAPAVSSGQVYASPGKSIDVMSVNVNLKTATKALLFADILGTISYNAPGGNGYAAILVGTTEIQRVHWQSNLDTQGHLIAAIADLPAGASTIKVIMNDIGGGGSFITGGDPTVLQVLPLR